MYKENVNAFLLGVLQEKAILKKTSVLIVITGVLLILVVKSFIRPGCVGDPKAIVFLFGIFPNLLGSFLLPVGVFMFEESLFFLHEKSSLALYCFCCFCALVLNEYLQMIPLFMRTFDYYDIIASAIGLAAGFIVTSNIMLQTEHLVYAGETDLSIAS